MTIDNSDLPDVPAVTASYSGFVAGDDADDLTSAATCSTGATNGSDVGGYDTTCTGAAAANYTVGYTSGLMAVTQAAATVTA